MPKLGAREEHARAAAGIVTGADTSHYWEDSGVIGNLYQEALEIDVYAWDVWMIYRPGVLWKEELPPKPDFWMHNLWGVENIPRLDSRVFSEEVKRLLKK